MQTVLQAALPLGTHDPADPIVFKVSVGVLFEAFAKPFKTLEQGSVIILTELLFF